MERSTRRGKKVIAYLLGQYPCRTETFIAHEIIEMRAYFDIVILALRSEQKDNTMLPVIRLPRIFSIKLWISHLIFFVHHPWRYSKTIFQCLKETHRIRSLKAFYKSVYFEKSIRRYNIAHLHAHFATAPTDVVRSLSLLTGLPYSLSAHAHDIYVHNSSLSKKITEATFVVTCTHYNKVTLDQLVPEKARSKIFTVYHGIPLHQWPFQNHHQNKNDLPRIISIGRLVKKKGFQYTLKALYVLHKQGYPFHWSLVGEGPEYALLRQMSEEYGLTKYIHFMGWLTQQEIRELFSNQGILVQPSVIAPDGDRDGIPNVILEAMAAGIPVIATDLPSIVEVLSPNHGILVPPEHPIAIVNAILALYLDQDKTEKIIREARIFIEQFDTKTQTQKLAQIFKTAIYA